MLIPFGILLILVVYLIYSRNKFEKDIVQLYEKKFEEWKDNDSSSNKEIIECRSLVGLVFKQAHKIDIELLDEQVEDKLLRGKFQVKKRG